MKENQKNSNGDGCVGKIPRALNALEKKTGKDV